MNFSKVILVGHITKDIQLLYLPSGTPCVNFSIAINRRWRDANNNLLDDVCFVDCKVYGKFAEVINKYLTKGDPLMVEGELRQDRWEGSDGKRQSRLYVYVTNFQFLSGRNAGGREDDQ